MKKTLITIFAAIATMAIALSCQQDNGTFESAVYFDRTSGETVSEMLISSENAELLSEEYWEIADDAFEISAGNVFSTAMTVDFKNLEDLPKKNRRTV